MIQIPEPTSRVRQFEQLAYGLFVHWGLYSLVGQGEWYMKHHRVPVNEYTKLAEEFTADHYDPGRWAQLAKHAGMRYIVLTTRHHDGFSLYDTKGLNDFDAVHSAAGRDLIQPFVRACREHDIVPFFYHTTLDWRWDSDQCSDQAFEQYLDYLIDSVAILCKSYGPIGGFWFDGNWSRPDADWQEDRMYQMIRSHQPEAIIVNNSSIKAVGAIGHEALDVVTFEQGRPEPLDRRGMSQYLALEMCQTMNLHWGIAFDDFQYKSPAQIIDDLAICRRAGSNYLLNVGPDADGRIPDYERAALERVGQWVSRHQDAFYDVQPVDCSCSGKDFVVRHRRTGRYYYYAHDLVVQDNDHVTLAMGATCGERRISGLPVTGGHWLDDGQAIPVRVIDSSTVMLRCDGYPYGRNLVVRIAELQVDG